MVRHASTAAKRNGLPLAITVLGPDLYVCGPEYEPDRCLIVHEWIPQVDEHREAYVGPRATGAVTAIPHAHLLSLAGATHVEHVGSEDIDGVAVDHLRGTFTIADAMSGQSEPRRRELQWWFSGILRDDSAVDYVADEPFPFDVWLDHDGRIRRLQVSMIASVWEYAQSDAPSAMAMMETDPDPGIATITLGLSDFGATLDFTPPPDADVHPEPPPSVDPTFTGPIDAQKAAEEFEEMFGSD